MGTNNQCSWYSSSSRNHVNAIQNQDGYLHFKCIQFKKELELKKYLKAKAAIKKCATTALHPVMNNITDVSAT